MNDMRVQFGTLQNVLGKSATHDGFTFVPAAVELVGKSFLTDFYLHDPVGERPPRILARPIEQRYDAAWVRARLPRVFAFTPELSEVEKSLLDVGLVAVAAGSSVGFPFVCTDYYGRTGLMFSPDGPDPDTQRRLRRRFGRCCFNRLMTWQISKRPFFIPGRACGCILPVKMASRHIASRRKRAANQWLKLSGVPFWCSEFRNPYSLTPVS